MRMTRTAIVIGAGITGVSAAEWLRREGLQVTLIDRIAPGEDGQTSYGNAGLIARSAVQPLSEPGMAWTGLRMMLDPDSPLFVKWRDLPRLLPWLIPFLRAGRADRAAASAAAMTSIITDADDQHRALAAGTKAERFLRQGDYMYLFRDAAEYAGHEDDWRLRRAAGFTVTAIDRAALEARDPHLSPRYATAALMPDHAWLTDPGAYVAALAGHFLDNGGVFEQAEVSAISDSSVTLADGRQLAAHRIVLAAGVWSDALAGQLGAKAMVTSERGYHLFLKSPSFMPPAPFMVSEASFVVTPMDKGLRCAGIVEHAPVDAPLSDGPVRLLRKRIAQVYPTLDWEAEDVWMGRRPTTPDSLPHLGSLPGHRSILFAFGAQHVGLTLGPRMGRIVADLAVGRVPNIDLTPFRPDRFRR
jgi:D-amino-acid dehydrogenase